MAAAMEALRRLTAAIQSAQAAADTQPYPPGPAPTTPSARSQGTPAHVPPAGHFAAQSQQDAGAAPPPDAGNGRDDSPRADGRGRSPRRQPHTHQQHAQQQAHQEQPPPHGDAMVH
eukprot:4096003-Lingulodinium_polyedra.AAC.1